MSRLLRVLRLRTEYSDAPLGIDSRNPRFSWELQGTHRNVKQSAYQISVGLSEDCVTGGAGAFWNSGKVCCADSILRPYSGPALISRRRYYWQVRAWDQDDVLSDWSTSSWWEMGLLEPADWAASWIEPASASASGPMLRREFELRDKVVRARIYVTSRGLYQLFLNDSRVGTDELTPGFTSYSKRLQYQTYDVTDLVCAGRNAIGALLGEGWYAGVLGIGAGWNSKPYRYGNRLGLLLQLEATYRDGSGDRIITDETWKSSDGPIQSSAIYDGEAYDARLERVGWDRPGYDESRWNAIQIGVRGTTELVAQSGPPVRKMESIRPRSIVTSPRGEAIVDMGQNMVGWVRLVAEGPSGTTISVRHGEILDADGSLYTANLVNAKQTTTYTLKGVGLEVFEPHFTFQGFRYAAIQGYPGELTADRVTGIVLHSAVDPSGEFECSEPMLNRLQRNILWSQKGNFVDIPGDCPQRDERLGWTGDAQIFAPTAAFNANVASFFRKWLADLSADQHVDGNVPWVIPDVLGTLRNCPLPALDDKPAAGSAGWGDAAVIVPWTLFQLYGDLQFLSDQYASMTRWIEYVRQRVDGDLIWRQDFQFGDWAALEGRSTDTALAATAYFAHSADLISRTARVLGKSDASTRYEQLFRDIRSAFSREFVRADGKIGDETQTAYVLALQFDLLPAGKRHSAARHLAAEVRKDGHLTTGFLGTPWLLFALSEYGYLDEAYGLLLRRECPSWLYPITRGATTIWEQWNGIQPNGHFFDPNNNSFNHYAYGAVGDWMYRVVGGINSDPTSPGYRHIIIRPRPGGGLTRARVSHMTPYGRVSSEWNIEGDRFHIEVEIPGNTSATVVLTNARREDLLEGGRRATVGDGITAIDDTEGCVSIKLGSGRFVFTHVRHAVMREHILRDDG